MLPQSLSKPKLEPKSASTIQEKKKKGIKKKSNPKIFKEGRNSIKEDKSLDKCFSQIKTQTQNQT